MQPCCAAPQRRPYLRHVHFLQKCAKGVIGRGEDSRHPGWDRSGCLHTQASTASEREPAVLSFSILLSRTTSQLLLVESTWPAGWQFSINSQPLIDRGFPRRTSEVSLGQRLHQDAQAGRRGRSGCNSLAAHACGAHSTAHAAHWAHGSTCHALRELAACGPRLLSKADLCMGKCMSKCKALDVLANQPCNTQSASTTQTATVKYSRPHERLCESKKWSSSRCRCPGG